MVERKPEHIPPEWGNSPESKSKKANFEMGPKGIGVEVLDLESIYQLANSLPFVDKSNSILSMKVFDNDMFHFEKTWLNAENHKQDNGQSEKRFCLRSVLYLSNKRKKQMDGGFYNFNKVLQIKLALEKKGLSATLNKSDKKETIMLIEKNGCYIEINFGFPDKETSSFHHKKQKEIHSKNFKKPRSLDPYNPHYLTKEQVFELISDEPLYIEEMVEVNPKIRLRLTSENNRNLQIKDKSDFSKKILTYAHVYEQVISEIYQIDEITPSFQLIKLSKPVKEDNGKDENIDQPENLAISFDDIAGQDIAVAEAKKLIIALNRPELFNRRGVKRPKGILLYGPPGNGKTMLARAIANETQAEFIDVRIPDIYTKWFGDSTRKMQEVFDLAKQNLKEGKKTIIFLDELDGIGLSRSDSINDGTKAVVNVLLHNLDGIRGDSGVTVVGATNLLKNVDPAIIRPGRIDKLVHMGLPNLSGRKNILAVHIDRAKKISSVPEKLFSDELDLLKIAELTEGMSGADLANLINITLEGKVVAEIAGQDWKPVETGEIIANIHKLKLNIDDNKEKDS